MNPRQKTPLIYILSSHHSGSTILDLLLGGHPSLWTLGEFDRLWNEIRVDSLCGCGETMSNCPFWLSVRSKFQPTDSRYSLDFFRSPKRMRVVQYDFVRSIWRGSITDRWTVPAKLYGNYNVELLALIHEIGENKRENDIKWLVDSSKHIYRLFLLQQSDLFDIRLIHITKDPRGYVHSMERLGLTKNFFELMRTSLRWSVQNAAISHIGHNNFNSQTYIHIRYEDLASCPEETMRKIFSWLDVPDITNIKNIVRNYENHAIAGNQTRWKQTSIKLDDKWRNTNKSFQNRLTWAITGLVARKYGYQNE